MFVFPVVWSSAWAQRFRCSADDSWVQRQCWKMSVLGIGTKGKFGVRKLLEELMADDGASTNFCAFQVCLSGSRRVHATCEEKQQTGSASYWERHRKSQLSPVTIHRVVQPYPVLLWWNSLKQLNFLTADIHQMSTEPLPSGDRITVLLDDYYSLFILE